MNLDELTLGQIKELKMLFDRESCVTKIEERYVIVRTYSAGVFAGTITKQKGKFVVLENARRLWYWSGAASLSQLAMEGVKNPEDCKFPCEVNKIELTEAIEIIDCTEKAKSSISKVPIWEK